MLELGLFTVLFMVWTVGIGMPWIGQLGPVGTQNNGLSWWTLGKERQLDNSAIRTATCCITSYDYFLSWFKRDPCYPMIHAKY